MAAAHGEIAGGAVAAAVGAAPRGPARFIDRRRRWGRLQHRGVGLRDVRRHGFALGRKAERRMVGAADPAAPIDEGIEHHVQDWSVSWKATFCAPVAGSPESWSRAVMRLPPDNP